MNLSIQSHSIYTNFTAGQKRVSVANPNSDYNRTDIIDLKSDKVLRTVYDDEEGDSFVIHYNERGAVIPTTNIENYSLWPSGYRPFFAEDDD